ncbi:Cytochrome c oxidase subunit 5B, mitochondrial [Trichoplax sp. H2]|nr:Cytochrome c oxidase subunit 5B, mitochondrial [Trichoplax sp. H2]|eukprot:RDD46151.1 Cytochrome c oxidase subunit 5B, mitochondrial [Trichoplax sp. H2]
MASLTRLSLPSFYRCIFNPTVSRALINGVRHETTQSSDVGVTGRIPSASEQATGKEKFEHDAMMTGNTDPFDMSFHEGPWGTAVNPRGVPSHFDERILGCVCEPEATQIIYMTLKKGNPQQCDCGHWWKLVEAK